MIFVLNSIFRHWTFLKSSFPGFTFSKSNFWNSTFENHPSEIQLVKLECFKNTIASMVCWRETEKYEILQVAKRCKIVKKKNKLFLSCYHIDSHSMPKILIFKIIHSFFFLSWSLCENENIKLKFTAKFWLLLFSFPSVWFGPSVSVQRECV